MKHSFRRVAVVIAALASSIGLGATIAPTPAGAVQTTDTTALATDRCIVRATFDTFLEREATEEEKSLWADRWALQSHTYGALPIALSVSDEWLSKVVDDLYWQALERHAGAGEIAYWAGRLEDGDKVNQIGALIYGSPEFFEDQADSSNTTFVTIAYRRILDREPLGGDITYWGGRLNATPPTITRGGVASAFFASEESRTQRVEALYDHVLGRAADAPGLTYWVGRLAQVNDVELAASLASSPEYRTRAGVRCNPVTGPAYPITLATPLAATPADPPFTIDEATLVSAMSTSTMCSTPNGASTWHPTLLVTPPGVSAATWRSDLSAAGRLTGNHTVCALTLPSTGPDAYDAQDLTRSAQYVVRAVQLITAAHPAKGQVDIVARGLGGLSVRWALRWWGSLYPLVDDVVTIGVPNHGSIDAMHDGASPPTAISQQSRADSRFVAALNSGADETPGGAAVDYTNIASGHDRLSVGVGEWDTRERAWHLSGATNLRVQNQCPTTIVPGSAVATNAWVWAAVRDALGTGGAALASRLATTPCSGTGTPDVDLELPATIPPDSEPPLPDYVPVVAEEIARKDPLPTLATGPSTPPSTETTTALDASKICPAGATAESPTLLVPGLFGEQTPGMFNELDAEGLFDTGDQPVCWLSLPAVPSGTPCGSIDHPAFDLYRSSQYVAHVLDQMGSTGNPVDVIAHSRGGFDTAWALQWWPGLAAQVDDVVVLDSPLRGSGTQRYSPGGALAPTPCPVAEQSRADSHFMAALRLDPPRSGPDWTTIGTWDGASVHRTEVDQRQNAWRWPGAENIIVQQHCAGTLVAHGPPLLTAYQPHMLDQPWVMAAITDALTHVGPADVGRFVPGTTCGGDWRWFPIQELPQPAPPAPPVTYQIKPRQEPPLPAYVWDAP